MEATRTTAAVQLCLADLRAHPEDADTPQVVREFFGLANQHMRWEPNDLARPLDEHTPPIEIDEQRVPEPTAGESGFTANARRILAAMESLDDDEREVVGLIRVQGLRHTEASEVLGVSTRTVQRRLNRGRMQLVSLLKDLAPVADVTGP